MTPAVLQYSMHLPFDDNWTRLPENLSNQLLLRISSRPQTYKLIIFSIGEPTQEGEVTLVVKNHTTHHICLSARDPENPDEATSALLKARRTSAWKISKEILKSIQLIRNPLEIIEEETE